MKEQTTATASEESCAIYVTVNSHATPASRQLGTLSHNTSAGYTAQKKALVPRTRDPVDSSSTDRLCRQLVSRNVNLEEHCGLFVSHSVALDTFLHVSLEKRVLQLRSAAKLGLRNFIISFL